MMAADPQQPSRIRNLEPYLDNQNSQALEPFLSEMNKAQLNENQNSIPSEEDEEQSISQSSSVSYEEDILEEHQNAIYHLIENNKPLFLVGRQFRNKVDQECYINGEFKMCTFQEQLKALLYKLNCSRPDIVLKFNSYLHRNRTFQMFLSHIHYVYDDDVSIQLINLAFLVWDNYTPYLNMSLTSSEVEHIAKSLAQKLCKNKNIWNMQANDPNLQENKHRFIECYTQTIVLVMEGFFHNQYAKRSATRLKREHPKSEEEDQFAQRARTGIKLVKTQKYQ